MNALGGEAQIEGKWVLRALVNERDVSNITQERPGLLAVLEKVARIFDSLCHVEDFHACMKDRFIEEIGKCSLFDALDMSAKTSKEACCLKWLEHLIGLTDEQVS